jgi:hypothetical protein
MSKNKTKENEPKKACVNIPRRSGQVAVGVAHGPWQELSEYWGARFGKLTTWATVETYIAPAIRYIHLTYIPFRLKSSSSKGIILSAPLPSLSVVLVELLVAVVIPNPWQSATTPSSPKEQFPIANCLK